MSVAEKERQMLNDSSVSLHQWHSVQIRDNSHALGPMRRRFTRKQEQYPVRPTRIFRLLAKLHY